MTEDLLNTLKKYDLYNVHKGFCEAITKQSGLDDAAISKLLETLISNVYETGFKRGRLHK